MRAALSRPARERSPRSVNQAKTARSRGRRNTSVPHTIPPPPARSAAPAGKNKTLQAVRAIATSAKITRIRSKRHASRTPAPMMTQVRAGRRLASRSCAAGDSRRPAAARSRTPPVTSAESDPLKARRAGSRNLFRVATKDAASKKNVGLASVRTASGGARRRPATRRRTSDGGRPSLAPAGRAAGAPRRRPGGRRVLEPAEPPRGAAPDVDGAGTKRLGGAGSSPAALLARPPPRDDQNVLDRAPHALEPDGRQQVRHRFRHRLRGRPLVLVQHDGAARGQQPREASRQADRVGGRRRVRDVVHDEVEAVAAEPEPADGRGGVGAEDLEAVLGREAEPVLGDPDDERVVLDDGDARALDRAPEQVDLGTAAQAHQQDPRPAWEAARRGEGARPVLALGRRPVAAGEVDRLDFPADHQPALRPALDDADAPRERRARLEQDRAPAAPPPPRPAPRRDGARPDQRGCIRIAPSSRIASPFSMPFSIISR